MSNLPTHHDPNLLVGTETHDDAGIYRIAPDLALVQTVDFFPPVVDDPFVYGQIAAANALSDVYAMGGTPITALNLLCFPDDQLPMSLLGRILQGGAERCLGANCTIVGGHTVRDNEIKFGLAVTGRIHPDHILTNANSKPGDVLVLTKPLGTGFITTAAKRQKCPPELLQAACTSMIQLNISGRDAARAVGAHAATDITGFGLAGHAFEMAEGSHTTIVLNMKMLPLIAGLDMLDVTKHRTRASKTNREYTIAETTIDGTPPALAMEVFYDAQTSGGMLIAVPADRAAQLCEELKSRGALAAAIVGEVIPRREKALWLK